jgi:glycosyltransferase involved in cell wall biosynthesis
MINTDYSKGGAARVAYSLHEYMLNRSDMDPVFLSGRGAGHAGKKIVALGQSRMHEYVNALIYRISAKEGAFSTALWKMFIEQDLFQPDVIHLHNVHGYYLPNSVLETIKQYPVVWTLHDFWTATGRCAFPLECRGWEESCEYCPYKEKYPATWLRKNFKRNFIWRRQLLDKFTKLLIVVPSNTFFKQLSYFGMIRNNIKVVYNGVDTNIFKPLNNITEKNMLLSKLKLPQDNRPVLCFTARDLDEPRKGFDIFYRSLFYLEKKIRLILVGKISKRIYDLRLPNNIDVVHVGYVGDRNLLSDYLKVSDVLISPSKDETFGLAVLEALSCGVRPVVFKLPIFQEILGDWAIYSEEKTPPSLKDAILKSLNDRFPFQKKRSAYDYVCCNFSLDNMCKNYMELYDQIRNGGL